MITLVRIKGVQFRLHDLPKNSGVALYLGARRVHVTLNQKLALRRAKEIVEEMSNE